MMDRVSDRRMAVETSNERTSRRRILRVLGVSAVVCLALLFVAPALILRFAARPPGGAVPGGTIHRLAWDQIVGVGEPLDRIPEHLELPAPLGIHILPEVLSVQDAVEWENGWILLDARLGKLHFLHPSEGLTESWGGRGEGPGELLSPVAIELQDTILWVLNRSGLALDRFSIHSGYRARKRIQGGGCMVGLARSLFSLGDGALAFLRTCPPLIPGPGSAFVEVLDTTGWASSLLELPLGNPGSRRIHPFRTPVVASWQGGLLLGTGDAPCIRELRSNGVPEDLRCLPRYDRPEVPEHEREAFESRFGGISKLGFQPIEVPDVLPWYDQLFSTGRGLLVRRIAGNEEGELVLLPREGSPVILGSVFSGPVWVGERTMILARDLMQGTEIQVVALPWAEHPMH